MSEELLTRDELATQRDRLRTRKTQLELLILIADPRQEGADALDPAAAELAAIHEQLPPLEWGVQRADAAADVSDEEVAARTLAALDSRALLLKMLDSPHDPLFERDGLAIDYRNVVAERTGMIAKAEDLESRLNDLDPVRDAAWYDALSAELEVLYARLPIVDVRIRDLDGRLDAIQHRIRSAIDRFYDVASLVS